MISLSSQNKDQVKIRAVLVWLIQK